MNFIVLINFVIVVLWAAKIFGLEGGGGVPILVDFFNTKYIYKILRSYNFIIKVNIN